MNQKWQWVSYYPSSEHCELKWKIKHLFCLIGNYKKKKEIITSNSPNDSSCLRKILLYRRVQTNTEGMVELENQFITSIGTFD